MTQNKKKIDAKLVPVLREGIEIIKMVLFNELKPFLEKRYPERNPGDIIRLTGAVVNDLFGVENMEEPFASFTRENAHVIKKEVEAIATNFDHLHIPLTDALRIQYLCDSHEGMNSESVLEKAKNLNIILTDREVPLPGAFMSLVRSFGVACKILEQIKKE
ncbi:MAG: hypothetical protein B6I30_01025 [Desulfobacteraceae bacterium 4572_187]|nr:MAG: hypothetical protein B6I30_01025 [Desulfobacteraceae bacterium 4572_187]